MRRNSFRQQRPEGTCKLLESPCQGEGVGDTVTDAEASAQECVKGWSCDFDTSQNNIQARTS